LKTTKTEGLSLDSQPAAMPKQNKTVRIACMYLLGISLAFTLLSGALLIWYTVDPPMSAGVLLADTGTVISHGGVKSFMHDLVSAVLLWSTILSIGTGVTVVRLKAKN
jgi:hypothetical protein